MPVALITCPHCQRQIEAEEQQRGLRLRCPFPDCRKLFRWHPDGRCLPEAEPPRPATVVSEQFVYRDWRSQPPPRRTAQPPAAPVQEEVSVAVAEEAPVSLDELVALGLKPEKLRSQSSAAWWTALFFLGLLGMTGLVGWMVFRAERSREPHLASEAETLFREGNYAQALNKYRELMRQFPGSARMGEYSFYEQASLLRALLNNPRVDVHRLAGVATQFLKQYRQTPLFAYYRRDLAEALYQVARRAAEESRQQLDRLLLEQVQEIYAALQEIGFGHGDPGVRNAELSQAIQQASYAIRLAEARHRLQLAIQAAFQLQRPTLVEQTQQLFEQLRQEFAELANDGEITKQLTRLLNDESGWLAHLSWPTYQAGLDWAQLSEGLPALPVWALAQGLFPQGNVEWKTEAATASGNPPALEKSPNKSRSPGSAFSPPVVLADGSRLLAFHPNNGRLVWTAHLAGEKALRIIQRDALGGRIYVWAGEGRLLSAIETHHPRVVWTMRVPGYAPFVPAVAESGWYLVDPRGWVWYGDTVSGQLRGVFCTDYPLLPHLGLDPITGLVCVATQQKRTFALDPIRGRARVLRDGHGEGTLTGPPLPLLSGLLLPLAQKDQLQLLGAAWRFDPAAGSVPASSPSASVTTLLQWPGQRLLDTLSTGEFALLVSDRYELVLVQTVRGSGEPGRVLGKSKWTLTVPAAIRTNAARLAILGERLGDWWLAGPGLLLRVHWDDYREQLRQETFTIPPGDIRDFTWDTRFPNRLVLLLRENETSWRAVAWDITTATPLWQTTGKDATR
jgi:hypothetical protein